jgi:hypothetical protein
MGREYFLEAVLSLPLHFPNLGETFHNPFSKCLRTQAELYLATKYTYRLVRKMRYGLHNGMGSWGNFQNRMLQEARMPK